MVTTIRGPAATQPGYLSQENSLFNLLNLRGVMENTEYWEVTGAAPAFDGQITAKIDYKSYE